MDIKTILEMTKDWDEPEKINLIFNLTKQLDDSLRFWTYYLGKIPNPNSKKETYELIKIYGKPLLHKVFKSISESQEPTKFNIAYIKKACESAKEQERIAREREHADKQIAEARDKAIEVAKLTGEDVRKKNDIKDNGWKNFAKRTLEGSKEVTLIKEILNDEEIS